MKYTITGGAGFIGSIIAKHLLNSGHSLQIIDNMSNAKILNLDSLKNKVQFHQVDILNYEKLEKLLSNQDGIFHHAALIDVQESFRNEDLYNQVNVQGTKNIFEIAEKFNIKVVYASSAAVYGNCNSIPIIENNSLHPINPYGQTKLECEKIAEKFTKKYVKSVGLRYFNVFGPCQSLAYAGVISKFFENLRKGIPPIIFGDGNQIRDFIYVNDVAEANILAMESNSNGIYNIGSGKGTTILDLAKFMIKAFNYDFKPKFEPGLKNDVRISVADIKLAKQFLGWEPKLSLFDWILTQQDTI